MIALTRLPSGRRASTIGEASSIRRPTWATILLMIRRRCDSSVKRTSVVVEPAVALDPDLVRAVDHDLGDRVVGQELLERPVAERVVGDLLDEALAIVARQPGSARAARGCRAATRARSAAWSMSAS